MMKCTLALILPLSGSFAYADSPAEELRKLIPCHQALLARSEGTSAEMVTGAATPFAFEVIKDGSSVVYFVTATGISTLRNPKGLYNGKRFIVELEASQPGKPTTDKIKRTVDISPRGTLGSVCCENAKGEADAPVKSELDANSIAALKTELSNRLNTVTHSYQNDDRQMDVIGAVKKCENLGLPNSSQRISAIVKHYEELFKKQDLAQEAKEKGKNGAGKSATSKKSSEKKENQGSKAY